MPELITLWDLVFPVRQEVTQYINLPSLRLLPCNTPLVDNCHHLGYDGDLDTRTPLPGAAGNLILIQNLPILIGHIVNASLMQKRHNLRQVTMIIADTMEHRQISQYCFDGGC